MVATAARFEPAEFNRRAAMLRAANVVRTGGVRWADAIEPYHDRVREAVLAQLDPARRRALHEALALAFETPSALLGGRVAGGSAEAWASSQRDPETLAVHWREAGNAARAATYAQSAGDQALRALAFDRAADWYEQALDLDGDAGAAGVQLRVKLGDALSLAGCGSAAAACFEAAADQSPPAESLELRRRAADQLLRSGHFDRGIAAARAVLATIGMRLPTTGIGTLAALVWYRARLALRGLGFRERDKALIPASDLARIDTCWSVGMALMFVDTFVGFIFLTRALLLALAAGEVERIVRCMGMETGMLGSAGTRTWKRTERLIALATELADRNGAPLSRFFALAGSGGALFCTGRFVEAAEQIERALAILEDRSLGHVHERVTIRIFLMDTLMFLGRYRQLRRLQQEGLRDARVRGDLYAAVEHTVGNAAFAYLAADRPDLADETARDVMADWSSSGFHLEHMHDLEGRVRARLYTGHAAEAHALSRELRAKMSRSLLSRIQIAHWSVCYLAIGTALEMMLRGLGDRRSLAREVEAGARAIERERMPWAQPFAGIARAGLALHAGARSEAPRLLDEAARGLAAAGMSGYALGARDRAARLRGDEGIEELARVDEALRAEDVANPERMSRMLVPGFLT